MKNVWNLALSGGLLAIALGAPGHASGANPPVVATGFNYPAQPLAKAHLARHDGCASVPAAVIRSADGSQRAFAARSACDTQAPVAVMRAAVLPEHAAYARTRRVEIRNTEGMLPTIDCTTMEVAALHADTTDTTVAHGGQQAVYMVRRAPPTGTTLRNGDVLQILPQAAVQRAPVHHAADPASTVQIARIQPSDPPAHAIAVARVPRAEISAATNSGADGVQRAHLRTTQAMPDASAQVITLCSTPLSTAYDAAGFAPSAPAQWAPAQPAPK